METKRSVLSTLLKLHARLDLSFWLDIHRQFGDELAGSVYSGLFACDPTVAVGFLPKIPDIQPLADAISLQLQRYAEKLDPGPRVSRAQGKRHPSKLRCAAKSRDWGVVV